MAKRRSTVAAFSFVAISSLLVGGGFSLASRPSASTGLAITTPRPGETIVETGLQIAGTAPTDVLVSISITDTDRDQPSTSARRVDGSVTSDSDGRWVFVPQAKPGPGRYQAQASYKPGRNRTVDSSPVRFVVVNESGASVIPATSWGTRIAIMLGVIAMLAGIVVYHRRHGPPHPEPHRIHRFPHPHLPHRSAPRQRRDVPQRRDPPPRRDPPSREPDPESQPLFMNTTAGRSYRVNQTHKMQAMDDEMQAIEHALADTAESLEHSNTAIVALRHHIFEELVSNSPDPTDTRDTQSEPDPKRASPSPADHSPELGPPVVVKPSNSLTSSDSRSSGRRP